MNSRILAGLAVLAVLLGGGAAYVLSVPGSPPQAEVGDVVWPDLAADVNGVSQVVVEGPEGTATIARDAAGIWRLMDKEGYPVEVDLIRQAIVGLSRLTVVAPMTANPENYARLGVEDFGPDATSIQVTLSGEGIARTFLIGRYVVAANAARNGQAELYIREAGDDQSWHVRGNFSVPEAQLDWVDLKVVDVSRNEIAEVIVRHADGEEVRVSMPEEGADNFVITNIPEGLEARTEFIANSVGSSLGWLTVETVTALGTVPDGASVTTYTTWDGVQYDVTVFERDGSWWFTANQTGGEDADAFNARTNGWAYAISQYKATDFAKRMADLTQVPEPADEVAE